MTRELRPVVRPRAPSPALIVAGLALLAALGGAAYAATGGSFAFTSAKLLNGWTRGTLGSRTAFPGYGRDSLGVVHLRGSVEHGTSGDEAFVLPTALAPRRNVLLPDFTGDGTPAGVIIARTGEVLPVGSAHNALQTLDGMSFVARSAPGIRFTTARLLAAWRYGGQGSARPGYAVDALGLVHLRGGLAGGTSDTAAFVLPKALAPSHTLWLPVYTSQTTEGSLEVTSTGQVIPFGATVSGYASLDGISFARRTTELAFTKAKLSNMVRYGGFSSAQPGYVKDPVGVVHLRGGLAGPSGIYHAFVLPVGMRPRHQTLFPIYTYGGTEGAVFIGRTGVVIVDVGGSNAFASLDGISFVVGQ